MKSDHELRASLREPHDEARARSNWEAIDRRRRRAPSSPSRSASAFGVLAIGGAIAAIATFVLLRSTPPGPLLGEDGRAAIGVIEGDALRLDDGSEIAIEEGARLEVLENAGDHVRFWLHDGAAHFDIVPGGPRHWVIETGLVTVEVLGTAFRVEHGERDVTVSVERGTVLVRGPTAPGGMQRLRAGESLSVPTGEPSIVTAEASPEPTVAASVLAPSVAIDRAPPRTARPVIREPARVAAREEVPAPSADAVVEEAPGAARLRDADALRASGRLDEAATMLAGIADDATAGNERALAAFTLARLELDRRHHPAEAAAAFARAIELGLRAPLLEDARARRVEALALAGDAAGARAAADTYVAHHPDGRWRSEVDRWSAAP